jgi:hypothetical protein
VGWFVNFGADECFGWRRTTRFAMGEGRCAAVPTEFALSQNYPNPFNPTTTIQYDLPMNAHVTLTVTNILGQEVVTLVNGVEDAGTHKVQFNANNITSGIYFYTINASNGDQKFSKTYKMMLMK